MKPTIEYLSYYRRFVEETPISRGRTRGDFVINLLHRLECQGMDLWEIELRQQHQMTKIIVLSSRKGVVRTGFNAISVTAGFLMDAPVFLWIFSPR